MVELSPLLAERAPLLPRKLGEARSGAEAAAVVHRFWSELQRDFAHALPPAERSATATLLALLDKLLPALAEAAWSPAPDWRRRDRSAAHRRAAEATAQP